MSDSTAGLQRQIGSAADLQSVVRTMRALAASSITQYEQSVAALAQYQKAIDAGLGACLREAAPAPQTTAPPTRVLATSVIVFGSDQGLVGQFNDVVVERALTSLSSLRGEHRVWAVGERAAARLEDGGIKPAGVYEVPHSVDTITSLVGRMQLDIEAQVVDITAARLLVFHNRPLSGALYEPARQQVLPLDAAWRQRLADLRWEGRTLPEVLGPDTSALRALIREHLFISLFRACAESLASENASRLAAMERADRNIDELLEALQASFHRLRQSSIDEELFDVTAGYESLRSPT
jgi:F-type H+-transporting ATPase subunit gamma